jgi:hypothetical protein
MVAKYILIGFLRSIQMKPCDKCLIKPMCKNPCEEFISYLRTNLPQKKLKGLNLAYLAYLVLSNYITLDFEYSEGWRWNDLHRYKNERDL